MHFIIFIAISVCGFLVCGCVVCVRACEEGGRGWWVRASFRACFHVNVSLCVYVCVHVT